LILLRSCGGFVVDDVDLVGGSALRGSPILDAGYTKPRFEVPDAGGVIVRGGDGVAAVGGDCNGMDVFGVAFEDMGGFAGGEVPDAGGVIVRGGDGVAAVGGDCDGIDVFGVAFEDMGGFAGGEVPDTGGPIERSGDGMVAVLITAKLTKSVWPTSASAAMAGVSPTDCSGSTRAVSGRTSSGDGPRSRMAFASFVDATLSLSSKAPSSDGGLSSIATTSSLDPNTDTAGAADFAAPDWA
jgi:hypothetical protein